MNFVSAWQFAYSAYWNSVFLGHKWDFSLNGVAPLAINNSAGTWKDAGRWGGIWQNTCSKLTKTSVRLLCTTVSNSCENLRFLRVFCVVWEQHDRCLGSWKTFARSWSPARHGPAKVARVHWTHHQREGRYANLLEQTRAGRDPFGRRRYLQDVLPWVGCNRRLSTRMEDTAAYIAPTIWSRRVSGSEWWPRG